MPWLELLGGTLADFSGAFRLGPHEEDRLQSAVRAAVCVCDNRVTPRLRQRVRAVEAIMAVETFEKGAPGMKQISRCAQEQEVTFKTCLLATVERKRIDE